jgi:hypothetical protein
LNSRPSVYKTAALLLKLGRHGCIMVDWSRPFDDPIQPPKGKKLVTLKDAAAYILALPKSKQQSSEWQAAGEAVIMAAEDRGPLMHAHVGMDAGAARRKADSGIRFVEREALGTAKAEAGRIEAEMPILSNAAISSSPGTHDQFPARAQDPPYAWGHPDEEGEGSHS